MIPFDIVFDEPAWPELDWNSILVGRIAGAAVLSKGTSRDRPSVALRIETEHDNEIKVIIVQTSARLFCTAAKMIMARYPDLFEGD